MGENVENIETKIMKNIFFDEHRNTQLHYFAVRNQIQNVRDEIGKYKIDFGNDIGWTPLMMATRYGFLDIVKILLENGADATKCNRYGKLLHKFS